jgi:tetratricopeptide (TPR) repeat protein
MLATSLGGIEGLQVVANSRLVELTPPARAESRGAITDAARRAGATEVIEGELSTEGGRLVLALRRVDVARGVVRKGYLVRATDRYALVDSAAATIARDLGAGLPTHPIGDLRTSSPEAYLLYNEGLRAFYGFDAPGGYRLMNAALERDSTFAMAAFYAWIIGEGRSDAPTARRELERVKRLAPHTIERERLLLQAEVATREAPIAVTAAIAETLTVRYPADPDGHIVLGKVRDTQGDYARAIASYYRAFVLDSVAVNTRSPYCRMCLALARVMGSYLWWDSAAAAERVGRRLVALRPGDEAQQVGLVEPLLRQGRRAEAEAALERSGTLRFHPEYEPFAMRRDLIRWGRLEELDRELTPDLVSSSPSTRGNANWFLLLSLRDRGRLREGRTLALEGRVPGSGLRLRGHQPELVLSATMLAAMGRPDSAARLLHAEARRVLADTGRSPGSRARDGIWRLTLAGTAYAQAGDTAMVRRLADSVETLGMRSTFGRDLRLHHYLHGLLLQRSARHAEAVDQFRRAVYSYSDGYSEINLALARSLVELGRPAEAVAVLRPAIHGGVDGNNTYTSRPELHEAMARAFELVGQRDSAVAHHRAVELAWRQADPEFAERYARARAAVNAAGARGITPGDRDRSASP